MELKTRNEMDQTFTWDLSPIYKDHEQWQIEYDTVKTLIPTMENLIGTLSLSKESFQNALNTIYKLSERVERIQLYTFLQKSQDNGDNTYQEMDSKSSTLLVSFSTAISFLEPEILAIEEAILSAFMSEDDMEVYKHIVDNILRGKAHTLDGEKEKLLAMLGEVSSTPSDIFNIFNHVDMTFPTILDEEGKEVQLTHGNFTVFRESGNPRVRKEAFEAYFNVYEQFINTTATTYAGSIKKDAFLAKARDFESSRHSALFDSNVPITVYDNLIEAIHLGLPTMKKYLALRKKALNQDVLNVYDLYCPMIDEISYPVDFESGKLLVKEACKPLGETYASLLDEAFENKWIDVYENKGKTTGAYACGVYGTHPYILLNYTDTLDDSFTLAHELGHAMHSYLSCEKQAYQNHSYKITVAEVASTVNEVLLTMHLLKVETDKKRRAYILNHFLEGFRTTVFRQTLFAEFEHKAHEMYWDGIPLTAKGLNKLYFELNELYYEGATINKLQEIEWSRIPHFYRYFYVYQYATGFCSAVAIANQILETGDPSNYLNFLATGGSDYPINELKIAGIDLTNPQTVQQALKIFDDCVNELTQLMNVL